MKIPSQFMLITFWLLPKNCIDLIVVSFSLFRNKFLGALVLLSVLMYKIPHCFEMEWVIT